VSFNSFAISTVHEVRVKVHITQFR